MNKNINVNSKMMRNRIKRSIQDRSYNKFRANKNSK